MKPLCISIYLYIYTMIAHVGSDCQLLHNYIKIHNCDKFYFDWPDRLNWFWLYSVWSKWSAFFLFQRLTAFVEDNLLRKDTGISHHGQASDEDEELCPSLHNFIVLTWPRLLHPELPRLVKQRYGTDLRARTLVSIKPEISQHSNL